MKSGDEPSAGSRPKQTKDVPAECAAFERLLASLAGELGNVSDRQFDGALTECLRKLVEFLGFDRSTVMMFSDQGRSLSVTHCWARTGIACAAAGTRVDELGWFTHQIRLGHILRMANIENLPVNALNERKYVNESGLKSTISIPLAVEDAVVGAVSFGTLREERHWPAEMVWRLRLVGEILALALLRHHHAMALKALVQTVNQMSPANLGANLMPMKSRRRAVDLIHMEHEERRRMSEVLHEDVMQMLVAVGMFMEGLRKADTHERSTILVRTNDLIQEALKKLRKLVMELHPDALSKSGLVEELRWLAEQMFQTYGLSVELSAEEGIEPLKQDTQIFLSIAVRKLLDNIAAHSHSNSARIEVWRIDAENVCLTVSDEGTGFDTSILEDIPSQSFGLFDIREEAVLLGGQLEVVSSTGSGTRIILQVPG